MRRWLYRRNGKAKNQKNNFHKMEKKLSPLLVGHMLKKLAPKIGAKVTLEPVWKIVGQIAFKNGRKRYFRFSNLDLNTLGASEISKDKDFANFFMKKMGYPTISGKTFFSDELCKDMNSRRNMQAAYVYAKKLGFPVIVKPNGGSQGVGVCKAYNKQELYKALNFIFKRDRVSLVQRFMQGDDYRIVVLDDKVISAYQRIPLNVTGDGGSTILQLLGKKQATFLKAGRDTKINPKDFRIIQKLKHQGLKPNSVIKKSQRVFLLDNANLSSGGDAIDVTEYINFALKKVAVQLTKDMGLRFCGVDILVLGSIKDEPKSYCILEINSAPGLDHYVLSGKKQKKIVEGMYLKILKAME